LREVFGNRTLLWFTIIVLLTFSKLGADGKSVPDENCYYSLSEIRTGATVSFVKGIASKEFGPKLRFRAANWNDVDFDEVYGIPKPERLGLNGLEFYKVDPLDPCLEIVFAEDGSVGMIHTQFEDEISLMRNSEIVAHIGEQYSEVISNFRPFLHEDLGDKVTYRLPDGQTLVLHFLERDLIGFTLSI